MPEGRSHSEASTQEPQLCASCACCALGWEAELLAPSCGLWGCGHTELGSSGAALQLGAVLDDGLWALQGCWDVGMLKFGHLGIWDLVLGCGSAGLQKWMQVAVCLAVGLPGHRAGEASGCWAQGSVGGEGCGIQGRRAAQWKDAERRAKDAGALRDCGAGKGAGGGDEELMGRAGPGWV